MCMSLISRFEMETKKKQRKQQKRNWIAAKRLATSLHVPTKNAPYRESDSDNHDSDDKCTSLTENSGNEPDVFVENVPGTESDVKNNEIWDMIEELVVLSTDSLSSDEETSNIASDLVSWINKHQIKHSAADDLLKL